MKVRIVTAKRAYECTSTTPDRERYQGRGSPAAGWKRCRNRITMGERHATFQEYGETQRCCMRCAKARGLTEEIHNA